MSAAPPFELTATYDDASVQAAARMLFWKFWKVHLPLTAGAVLSVLAAAGFLWYIRLTTLMWFALGYPLIIGLSLVLVRWGIQRRLMRRLGKSVEIRLTFADCSITSEGESHTLPWSRFKSVLTDEHNLYLFITSRTAFVFPTRGLNAEALQFAFARVAEHATAV